MRENRRWRKYRDKRSVEIGKGEKAVKQYELGGNLEWVIGLDCTEEVP